MIAPLPDYAELHCVTNFSFLRGASHGEELVERAFCLGYKALAITDECSLAGVVRAHEEAKKHGLKLLIGAEFKLESSADKAAFRLVVLACTREGYGNLAALISKLRMRSPKGQYELKLEDIEADIDECVLLIVPERTGFDARLQGGAHSFDLDQKLIALAQWFAASFAGRAWLACELLHRLDDALWLSELEALSALSGLPLCAAGDVHMHVRSRKPLQDVLTATRLKKPVSECGFELAPNAEQHLRSRIKLAQLYPRALLEETLRVAERCDFSLDELRYEYPDEVVPSGMTAREYLQQQTELGLLRRYPNGVSEKLKAQIAHELAIIADLGYEHYFLTVYDIVRFAREQGILCQGRGSAANSAVCYCLGITEVDPARMSVLFERFISKERNEPPDIDVDFEHERREEVIQYLYAKYGRDRAALTATVISYRPRSAIRDVGKALGMPPEQLAAFARGHHWWDGRQIQRERLLEAGFDPASHKVQLLMQLTVQMIGFPRHLGQHTGGFVLAKGQLSRLVPIERASMENRSVIEWDKDDLDALGLLKVDVLALGMLSAIARAVKLIEAKRGTRFLVQDIPAEDAATYDMICDADTVGVFQIESRAQQSMLPRLRPREFYDLVIEVAIVRPGPIQGGMVHPYLKRRQGIESVEYPSDALRQALGRTLGVPIFQEQVMQIAILAAGFSAGEADSLRRSMAAWKRKGGVHKFYERVVGGMTERGYTQEFAERIFKQIEGFGEYGFPESHAASFALLVYVSCWIKCHEPAIFLCALLNSQPMGFYSPSQLTQDATRHGVRVLPVDVQHSQWECTMEDGAVRLGLCMVSGLAQTAGERVLQARAQRAFYSTEDMSLRSAADVHTLKVLAAADALKSLSGNRRQQVWDTSALKPAPALFKGVPVDEERLELADAPLGENIVFDYASLGLSLRAHPLSLLRAEYRANRFLNAQELADVPNGRLVRAVGLVTMRQQPQTAKGTMFVTLEDETGQINVIVWKKLRDAQRTPLLAARLMVVYGVWQCQGKVRHLIAKRVEDASARLGRLRAAIESRDFR